MIEIEANLFEDIIDIKSRLDLLIKLEPYLISFSYVNGNFQLIKTLMHQFKRIMIYELLLIFVYYVLN